MNLVVLTGASGSGKTTIAKAVERAADPAVVVRYFDHIGVPSLKQMSVECGSSLEWQRSKTYEWLERLANPVLAEKDILFEGQTRIQFIEEGIARANIATYEIILVDCDDDTRKRRLIEERRQPELANPDMLNWAKYLRREASAGGYEVIDTSLMSLDECVERVMDAVKGRRHRPSVRS